MVAYPKMKKKRKKKCKVPPLPVQTRQIELDAFSNNVPLMPYYLSYSGRMVQVPLNFRVQTNLHIKDQAL